MAFKPRFSETSVKTDTPENLAPPLTAGTVLPENAAPMMQTETLAPPTAAPVMMPPAAPLVPPAPAAPATPPPAIDPAASIEMSQEEPQIPEMTTGTPAPAPQKPAAPKAKAAPQKPLKSKLQVKAEDCSFKINAPLFQNYLEKISLDSLIKDAYIEVNPASLFCKFAESTVQYVSGYLELPGAVVEHEGKIIISDIDELIRVIKHYGKDDINISYHDGEVTIKSTNSKKKETRLVGLAESYVSSLEGVFDKYFDAANGTISKTQYTSFSSFKTTVDEFKSVINAGKAIGLPFFLFRLRKEGPSVECAISNQQKTYEAEFTAQELRVVGDLDVAFARGIDEVMKQISGEIVVYVGESCMVITQGATVYMFLPVGE